MAEVNTALVPQDVAVGKPVFRVLDLADDSLKSPKPRIPVSVDSFDDLKSRGHHRDLPRSGSALYVETQSAAEAGPNAQLTGPNVVTYAEEKFRPSPRSDIATRVVRQGRRTLERLMVVTSRERWSSTTGWKYP